ncbi:right-handed parallel beta-helix repeat-containing protein [Chloroflexota bacterium]
MRLVACYLLSIALLFVSCAPTIEEAGKEDTPNIPNEESADSEENGTENISIPIAEPLVIQASANTTSGRAVLPVVFSCSVSGGLEPYSYSWDFDARDGRQVDKYHNNATFVFAEAGSYQITVIVNDNIGQEASDTLDIEVLPQELTKGTPIVLQHQHGTEENPIIIEGLDIAATEGQGINLVMCSNVVIRNNYIHDVSSPNQAEGIAIRVQDSSDIEIYGNYLLNNQEGMCIWSTPESDFQQNISVHDNVVIGSDRISGINIGKTDNVNIYNNYVKNNGNPEHFENGRITGIIANTGDNINIHDNVSVGNSSDGIGVAYHREYYLQNPEYLMTGYSIYNNTSRGNGEQGIWLMGATDGEVHDNYIESNYNENPSLGSSGIMLEYAVSEVSIYRNYLKNNEIAGIDINMSHNITISENIINESSANFGGIWIREEYPTDWQTYPIASSEIVIKNNLFYQSRLGIFMQQGENTYILNNTMYKNGVFERSEYGSISGILIDQEAINTLVQNNIITSCTGIGIYSKDTDDAVLYNDFWNNEADYNPDFAGGEGNVSEDPRFVSPEAGNFMLNDNSPCKGAGLWHEHLEVDVNENDQVDIGQLFITY